MFGPKLKSFLERKQRCLFPGHKQLSRGFLQLWAVLGLLLLFLLFLLQFLGRTRIIYFDFLKNKKIIEFVHGTPEATPISTEEGMLKAMLTTFPIKHLHQTWFEFQWTSNLRGNFEVKRRNEKWFIENASFVQFFLFLSMFQWPISQKQTFGKTRGTLDSGNLDHTFGCFCWFSLKYGVQ